MCLGVQFGLIAVFRPMHGQPLMDGSILNQRRTNSKRLNRRTCWMLLWGRKDSSRLKLHLFSFIEDAVQRDTAGLLNLKLTPLPSSRLLGFGSSRVGPLGSIPAFSVAPWHWFLTCWSYWLAPRAFLEVPWYRFLVCRSGYLVTIGCSMLLGLDSSCIGHGPRLFLEVP